MNLSVNIGGLELKNPVVTASGTFGYGVEYAEFLDLNLIGAITVKGLSLRPAKGNPPGRVWETPCGMLNAIGLQNIGIDAFIKDKLPELRKYDTKIIANFFGDTIEEYVEAAAALSAADGVHALEMNISCPNKQAGWIAFGTDPALTEKVVTAARRATKLPLIVKLSPNVTSIADMARAAVNGGADALSVINTITGMAIDIETRRPRLSNIVGGLSGPAIRPIAVRMVFQAAKAVTVPIIGMGGIMTGGDAIEFILAGASAVAIGTANFVNPAASVEVLDSIKDYIVRNRIDDINTLVGGIIC
ncbi:MAG: dihydroorotate dehydrogenase [Nitrospirae bacterium]|nr:dihydroorotate dehydrogenase [Nitrospirota bacterium]